LLLGLEQLGITKIDKQIKLTALTIAGVVCIAASNGGSTAQALKVGHIRGATPRAQQWAILIGALTSALAVGLVLLALNEANSTYSRKAVEPLSGVVIDPAGLPRDRVRSGPYAQEDKNTYGVLNVGRAETDRGVPPGRYLVDDQGKVAYLVDPAINGLLQVDDQGNDVSTKKFDAPKTVLMQLIIDGILDRRLPWSLVLIGVLIAVTLELSGVASLPFAVGVYLPLAASTPIFAGGLIRWLVDKWRGRGSADDDSSPAILLSSGYIAGGAIAAVLISFLNFAPEVLTAVDFSAIPADGQTSGSRVAGLMPAWWFATAWPAMAAFSLLALILWLVGVRAKRSAS
jgi:hypothetical protein